MRWLKTHFVVVALALLAGQTPLPYGPAGEESAPDRRQSWLVPTPVVDRTAHAVLFRPPGNGPFRLALIAHASTQSPLRRAQMPQLEYRALAASLVARGFAVLVPERLGHGATGGDYLEDQSGCEESGYIHSARATADQIHTALAFMRSQSFIQPDNAVVIGHSAGGWGALALDAEDPKRVAAIIAFAPGRGGHADDAENSICGAEALKAAAKKLGHGARVPVTWLVSANDSYFSPAFSRTLVDAYRADGGVADFRMLPASGKEGHWLAESESGVASAASDLDRALKAQAVAKKR